jgi:RNA polymerase sigma factor (sigma-70 family)
MLLTYIFFVVRILRPWRLVAALETIKLMPLDAHEVLTQFAPAFARIAASYERDPALREELLQEILLAVVSSLPRLKQADKLKPFLFRIAHNRCLSHVTQRMRERTNQEAIEDLAADTADQDQMIIERERGQRLLEAIRRLALPYRQVMTLVLEDMNYEEIGEALAISVANVGIRVNRAKQQLKGLLHHE